MVQGTTRSAGVGALTADQRIERISRGREATVASGLLRPIIDRQVEKVLSELCRSYQAGDTPHDLLVGGIAEITALRELLYELERIHKQGVAASGENHASN